MNRLPQVHPKTGARFDKISHKIFQVVAYSLRYHRIQSSLIRLCQRLLTRAARQTKMTIECPCSTNSTYTRARATDSGKLQSRNLAWNSAFERHALTSDPSPHTFACDLAVSTSRRLSTPFVNKALEILRCHAQQHSRLSCNKSPKSRPVGGGQSVQRVVLSIPGNL